MSLEGQRVELFGSTTTARKCFQAQTLIKTQTVYSETSAAQTGFLSEQ